MNYTEDCMIESHRVLQRCKNNMDYAFTKGRGRYSSSLKNSKNDIYGSIYADLLDKRVYYSERDIISFIERELVKNETVVTDELKEEILFGGVLLTTWFLHSELLFKYYQNSSKALQNISEEVKERFKPLIQKYQPMLEKHGIGDARQSFNTPVETAISLINIARHAGPENFHFSPSPVMQLVESKTENIFILSIAAFMCLDHFYEK